MKQPPAIAVVLQLYLEDAYEMTGYVLEAGSLAALRGDGRQWQRQQLQKGSASKQGVLKVAFHVEKLPRIVHMFCHQLVRPSVVILTADKAPPRRACLYPVLAGMGASS